jgi:hypothetical protein
MNLFAILDRLFPVLPLRLFGEVVSVSIQLGELTLYQKVKAGNRNTSVNAFHMHRSLVRQFKQRQADELSFADENAVKRLIVLCTLDGYLLNFKSNCQLSNYVLLHPDLQSPRGDSWSGYRAPSSGPWFKIEDVSGVSLYEIISARISDLTSAVQTEESPQI